ncbi:MAG: tetratricopeptide repeat protein [bacterium]|nr:tetratricopeptide repeat protein [bacterium]
MVNIKIFKERWIQLLIICLLTLIAYINILGNGFAWDDRDFFIDWPQIKSSQEFPAYLSLPYLLTGDVPLGHRGIYRPVRSIYYLISYSLWGENPLGYHIQAIIVHILIVLVIYLITEQISKKRLLAFITATLFATHPIHTEAVTYITASMDTLGILFFFLSFYLYLKTKEAKSRRNIYLLASVIYAFLAFFTYEMTLVLPLLIILYDFCANKFSFKSLIPKINYYKYYILGLASYGLVRFVILGIGNRADYLGVDWIIAANQARVGMPEIFAHYLWWLIWPINLTIGHDLTINLLSGFLNLLNNLDPTDRLIDLSAKIIFLFPLLYALAGIFFLYLVLRKYPLYFFGLTWIIISILPVSSIIPQGATVAERYLYIPSFGFLLVLGLLLTNKRFSYSLILLFLVITASYIFLTVKRNTDWRDEKTIWQAVIRNNPQVSRAYTALANAYVVDKQYDEGIKIYLQSLQLNPSDAKVNSNLGLAYNLKGETDKAIAYQKKALEINPGYANAYVILGNIYLKQKEYDLAEKEYKKALEIKKDDPLILTNLGKVYYNQARYDLAIEAFKKSLSLNPNQPLVYSALEEIYKKQGAAP